MEKRGFLERLGLIEKVPVENGQDKEDLDRLVKAVLKDEDKELKASTPLAEASLNLVKEPELSTSAVTFETDGRKSDTEKKFTFLEDAPFNPQTKESIIKIDNNKALSISEIYKLFNQDPQASNAIFVVENFLKALPPLLSEEIKRDTVLKIISSAGMDLNQIISDGKTRLKNLNEYSRSFESSAIKNIAAYEKEIDRLSSLINEYQKSVKGIREESEKQTAIISSETEKVHSILDFINVKY